MSYSWDEIPQPIRPSEIQSGCQKGSATNSVPTLWFPRLSISASHRDVSCSTRNPSSSAEGARAMLEGRRDVTSCGPSDYGDCAQMKEVDVGRN